MAFRSTKTYCHEVGLSCAFRQWRADHSHCRFLHGYAIAVGFVFEADELDGRNWVVDFGSLKFLKTWLEDNFDHKTIVAEDDPQISMFRELAIAGVIEMTVLPDVGCEKFAEFIYRNAAVWLEERKLAPRVRLVSVEVREHGANSAIYTGET